MTLHDEALHEHLTPDGTLRHVVADHPDRFAEIMKRAGVTGMTLAGWVAWADTRLDLWGVDRTHLNDGERLFVALHEWDHRESDKTQTLAEGLELGQQETISTGSRANLERTACDEPMLFSVGD